MLKRSNNSITLVEPMSHGEIMHKTYFCPDKSIEKNSCSSKKEKDQKRKKGQ